MHVGSCCYVLSCQALNVTASRGPGSNDAYPVLKHPQVWLSGVWVCAELGLEDKTGWADMWQGPTRPWLPRLRKGLVQIIPRYSSF
jgi:hypothetical protein